MHEVALCDFNGTVELCKRQSSTFISSLSSSPALVNDNCDIQASDKFAVEAKLFTEIDDGTIDLISIDTEGSEWFVIKNMKSRPSVISIETHGGMYTNPYLDNLLGWMQENNYTLWYKDKSDSVYVLANNIPVTFLDKLNLVKADIIIAFASNKKRLSRKLKGFFK